MWHQTIIILLLLRLPLHSAQVDETNCPTSALTASASEQTFQVYKNALTIPEQFTCTWKINGDGKKSIIIHLQKDESASPNQCVKVGGNQTICTTDEYPLVETFAEKTEVYYPGKDGLKDVKPFPVNYLLGHLFSCGPSLLTATPTIQSFRVNRNSDTIPTGYQCRWVIDAKDQKIEIVIDASEEQNQCIKLTDFDDRETTLCATTTTSYYESTSLPVIVSFPGKAYTSAVRDFKIYYKLANSKDCGKTQLTAKTSPQVFPVSQQQSTIQVGHQCSWMITAEKTPIYVQLEGVTKPEQCVKVENQLLCATKTTQYKSSKSPVYVMFPGEAYNSPMPNFNISYKSAATDQRTLLIPMFGLLAIWVQIANNNLLN